MGSMSSYLSGIVCSGIVNKAIASRAPKTALKAFHNLAARTP